MTQPAPTHALCATTELIEGGDAVPFDVLYAGRSARGFAIRFEGRAYAYLNQCAHIPMEMDYQPNQFFDSTGQWLVCATHGAMYSPTTGQCVGGPCRGGLIPIDLNEYEGVVYWHTGEQLKPIEF